MITTVEPLRDIIRCFTSIWIYC